MHSTALFFCVLFFLISNHFFAQFLCKRKLFRQDPDAKFSVHIFNKNIMQ